jgi:DNA-binding response OmpR family regulator
MDRKTILVVDDDDATRSSLSSILASDVVAVRTASTRKEAERLIETERFDLAIVDLSLTGRVGMEGLELISKIKERAPQTVVAVLTGYGSPEIEREARRRGADQYWEKTLPIPALVERIRALGIPVGSERQKNGSGFAAFNGG